MRPGRGKGGRWLEDLENGSCPSAIFAEGVILKLSGAACTWPLMVRPDPATPLV
jgi:hypothetical protein